MSRPLLLLTACFILLTGAIVWGHTVQLFYPFGVLEVFEVFWGKLVLLDFVASLLLVGVWIAWLHPPEQRLTRGVPWTLGVVILGTPVALVFFILRARRYRTASEVFLQPAVSTNQA